MQAFPRLVRIENCTKETRFVGEVELVEAGVFGGRFKRVHRLHYEVEFGELSFESCGVGWVGVEEDVVGLE